MDKGELLHPLSSDKKAEGMKRFTDVMPKLLARNLPSRRALPIMHRLVTIEDVPSWPRDTIEQTLTELITRNNPHVNDQKDIKSAESSVEMYLRHVFRKKPEAWRVPKEIRFASSRLGGKASSVIIGPKMLRRGHLRKAGERILPGQEKETLFVPNLSPIHNYADLDAVESFYIGPAYKLDELFDSLCQKNDELQRDAKTLDEHLTAIVLMQLLGAQVIHPFYDGNGRAFAAKLIYDLNKLGFPVKEMPTLPELHEKLATNLLEDSSFSFMRYLIEQNGLGLARPNKVSAIVDDRPTYNWYMERLYSIISSQIQEGTPKDEVLGYIVKNATRALEIYLSREVMRAEERGETFGPPPGDPFHISASIYRDKDFDIVDVKENEN